MFLEGDFFWRLPLLLRFLFVVPSSCLRFLGLLRCLEEVGPVVLSFFLLICLLFAPSHIMSFVILFVCWLLVSRLLLLRDRESVSSCNLVWCDLMFLWCTEGEGRDDRSSYVILSMFFSLF